jgi:hypothetical protein
MIHFFFPGIWCRKLCLSEACRQDCGISEYLYPECLQGVNPFFTEISGKEIFHYVGCRPAGRIDNAPVDETNQR